jgi:hypothetical protein
MARRFLVYRVGNNIKITTLKFDSESFVATLEKYYEALSNFAQRPVQKIQFITTANSNFSAKKYVDKNRKAILAMPILYHTGSNMAPVPYEGYDPLYERQCDVCGSIGSSASFVRLHFDNCKHKKVEEDVLDF